MSTLICTPCYGGQMTVGYFRGLMSVMDACAQSGYTVDFLVTEGESLVTRARNNMVATFLHQTDYEHLAFIDADIEIDGDDFLRLAHMSGVRGAAVNMKRPDHAECLSCFLEGKQLTRADMPAEAFAVDFLGAAVMFIERGILQELYEEYPEQRYTDPIAGEGCALFESEVQNGVYLSEDYTFCRILKRHAIPVVCDPSIVVSHYGQSVWRG